MRGGVSDGSGAQQSQRCRAESGGAREQMSRVGEVDRGGWTGQAGGSPTGPPSACVRAAKIAGKPPPKTSMRFDKHRTAFPARQNHNHHDRLVANEYAIVPTWHPDATFWALRHTPTASARSVEIIVARSVVASDYAIMLVRRGPCEERCSTAFQVYFHQGTTASHCLPHRWRDARF